MQKSHFFLKSRQDVPFVVLGQSHMLTRIQGETPLTLNPQATGQIIKAPDNSSYQNYSLLLQ